MARKVEILYDREYPVLKVGLCQVYTEPWAIEDNFRRTLDAIEGAAGKGAEVAVTPECVFHGYGPANEDGGKDKLYEMAEPLDGPRLAQVRQLARDRAIYVVVGFAELGTGDKLHNTAALISPGGDYLHIYRKVHCRPFEDINHDGYFTPGEEFLVNELHLGQKQFNAGTLICFDREIPESVRCLRSLGAEIIFCPLATGTSDLANPENCADNEMVTRIRAAENEVFIAVVNHAGSKNGGTFIVGPVGETICQLGPEPQVRVVDVPVGVISAKLHCNPLTWMGWGFRRQNIYDKYLKKD